MCHATQENTHRSVVRARDRFIFSILTKPVYQYFCFYVLLLVPPLFTRVMSGKEADIKVYLAAIFSSVRPITTIAEHCVLFHVRPSKTELR